MDQFLTSRMSKELSTKLQNLSPEKFGSGAYANLAYTPSKLANNILYRETCQMKKNQENGCKVREYQALNQILRDKLRHMQAEKQGIEQSLTQQIGMYKKMVTELQEALEQQVCQLQSKFSQEIQKIIQDKEEEAKYVQSEKQMLQNRIYELQNIIAELKEELNNKDNQIEKNAKEYEKLEIHFNNLSQTSKDLEKTFKEYEIKAQGDIKELNKKLSTQQLQFKQRFEKTERDKQRQIQNLKKLHQAQQQKIMNKHNHELLMKNQEIKELNSTLQIETRRMGNTSSKKDKEIQAISEHLNEEKDKMLKLTKQYSTEIATLLNEKRKLQEQCDRMSRNLQKEKVASSQAEVYFNQQITTLKKQNELERAGFLKERQGFLISREDMMSQIAILRKNIQGISRLQSQNDFLSKEVRNLKDLLMQSSLEMERCRDEFVRLATEKETFLIKLQELDFQNETLHRIKLEREEEVRAWRQSYYQYRK